MADEVHASTDSTESLDEKGIGALSVASLTSKIED